MASLTIRNLDENLKADFAGLDADSLPIPTRKPNRPAPGLGLGDDA